MLSVTHVDDYTVFVNPYHIVSVFTYEGDDYTTIITSNTGSEKIVLAKDSPASISSRWRELMAQIK